MLIVGNHYLLSDAEGREDGGEEVGGGYGTGDGTEVVEGLADVLGYHVGWDTFAYGGYRSL